MQLRRQQLAESFHAVSIGPVERRLMALSLLVGIVLWPVEYEVAVLREAHIRFLQTAQIAGVSAAITVLLGAPLTSAFFATEVMYRDKPLFEKLFYGLIAALSAYLITVVVAGVPVLFHLEIVPVPAQGWRYLLILIMVAVAVTIVGQLYLLLSSASDHWFARAFPNPVVRHLRGAVVVGIIALITVFIMASLGVTGHVLELVLGSGETAIVAGLELANVNELTAVVALIGLTASMLATLATISSGGSAGLLVPSLFFGSMIAVVFAQMSSDAPMELVPVAMTASLVAIAGTPITPLLFVVEAFGVSWVVPSLVVLIIAYLMSSPNSVYRTRQVAPVEPELLPGIGVQRLTVPTAWSGQTLADIHLVQYGLRIIGLAHQTGEGNTIVSESPSSQTVLRQGDVLALSGSDDDLARLDQIIKQWEL